MHQAILCSVLGSCQLDEPARGDRRYRLAIGNMRIGVVFPQTELGGDVGAVRAYAEAVNGLGYAHVLAYDHVLGAEMETSSSEEV